MIVFLNGEFVSEEQAAVSVFDRGFLYGDGLFETLRVCDGRPFRWERHLARLQQGAKLLRLKLPYNAEEMHPQAEELMRRNQMTEAVLRLQVSRGIGPRGYSIREALRPTVVMTLHPLPAADRAVPMRWRLITAQVRLPVGDPLAGVKTCNKLPYILARAEAEEQGADEALLLNTEGAVAEAASANVFWIERGVVCTPPLSSGALPGITRELVIELCERRRWPMAERTARRDELRQAEGVFLTLSSYGLVEVVSLDGGSVPPSPVVTKLWQDYQDVLEEGEMIPGN